MGELTKVLLAGAAVVLVFVLFRRGNGSADSSPGWSIGNITNSLGFAGDVVGFARQPALPALPGPPSPPDFGFGP